MVVVGVEVTLIAFVAKVEETELFDDLFDPFDANDVDDDGTIEVDTDDDVDEEEVKWVMIGPSLLLILFVHV